MKQKKRNKKKIILVVSLLSLIVLGVGLFSDFNVYEKGSKENQHESEGLILTITAFDGASESTFFVRSLGHAWIELDNQTDHSVYLMDYEIKSGEILTFSSWGIRGHFAVAYNLESAFADRFDRYAGRQSVSIRVEESKLAVMERYIAQHNEWKFVENCSYWSVHLWNEVADEEMRIKTPHLLYTPARLKKAFSEFTEVEVNRDYARAGNPFFYVDGKRTELELCE